MRRPLLVVGLIILVALVSAFLYAQQTHSPSSFNLFSSNNAQLGPTIASTTSNADFGGIYAIAPPQTDPTKQAQSLPDSFYTNPNIDGVFVQYPWSELEPSPGVYNWSRVDREMSAIVAAGKKISVEILPGASTPQWVYTLGAQKDSFTTPIGPRARCKTIDIPTPWDPTYQKRFAETLQAFASHIKALPGVYSAVRIVKITGVTTVTGEFNLPYITSESPKAGMADCKNITDAITLWQNVGYKPSKVIAAWTQAAQATHAAFPDKTLGVMGFGGSDTFESLPSINEKGQVVKGTDPTYVNVNALLLQKGMALFPRQFVAQWDGLSRWALPQELLDAQKQGLLLGWQSNERGGPQKAACNELTDPLGKTPCTADTYATTLQNGISHGATFLELWAPDILAFPQAVLDAQTQLKK